MTHEELDVLFDEVDDLLLDGQFETVNKMLVGVKDRDVDWIIGMLTLTLPAKSELSNRRSFFEAAEKVLDSSLLAGLA